MTTEDAAALAAESSTCLAPSLSPLVWWAPTPTTTTPVLFLSFFELFLEHLLLFKHSNHLIEWQCEPWSRGWWNEDHEPRVRGGVSGQRPKKSDCNNFDGRSGHKELQICFGWFSWSSRCIWVAVVTVLAVGESGRAIWTHWHPLNLSSEDGKKMVKKLYNIKHWC